MDKNLVDPDLFPGIRKTNANLYLGLSEPPDWLLDLGLPPVVEAEHDGEGTGRQHLLIDVVVQAVGCCQGKSVANLEGAAVSQVSQTTCCFKANDVGNLIG